MTTVAEARALQLLAHRFPKIPIWFGHATRNWWAMADGRLIEATNPEELGRLLDYAQPEPVEAVRSDALTRPQAPGRAVPPPRDMADRETAEIPAMRALAHTAAPATDQWRLAARPRPAKRRGPWRHRFAGFWVSSPLATT